MAELVLTLTLTFRDVEPTGEPCFCCGDACYLRAVGMFGVVDGKVLAEPSVVFCGACGDAISEGNPNDGSKGRA